MPIVATAGHVDHGKSTLIQALTGRDPDRWREEKERGLTIDLGFAWAEISGTEVGFVDVPGHERFIKNMLAGVGGLDVALLVVAADEGWMPQTQEHVGVLDLLDVKRAVVALTRVDIADADVAELATLEIEEQLEGTSLAGSPIVPVSAITGQGIDDIVAALASALDEVGDPSKTGDPPNQGPPRLWVDRSFTIAGAGTVVTGTLLDGPLKVGDGVELLPGPLSARIRTLQSHERSVERAEPGTRVAANLSGLDREQVERGALLTTPGSAASHIRLLVDVRPIRGVAEIANRGAYQLHAGTGAWPVRLRMVDAKSAVVTAQSPIPITTGDRYILRETGRRAVVGGGRVLDPRPPKAASERLSTAASTVRPHLDADPDAIATALLEVRGAAALNELAVDSRGGRPADAVIAGNTALRPDRAAETRAALGTAVRSFHEDNPLRPGAPKATLASSFDLSAGILESLVAMADDLVDEGSVIRAADHGVSWSDADESAFAAAAAKLLAAGMAAPRASQLGLSDELLHAALREARLLRIDSDLVYLPEAMEELKARLTELPKEFTVADFRDAMKISRRQAVPLLEWLDANAVTSRRGDVRVLRQSPQQ